MPNAFTKITDGKAAIIPVTVNGISANALIDTGSTVSCVSRSVAVAAKMENTGKTVIRSFHAQAESKIYRANIMLPGDITFKGVRLAEFIGGGTFDVLIGMDIITKGDLALSSANKETWLSFRVPSAQKHIDFTVA